MLVLIPYIRVRAVVAVESEERSSLTQYNVYYTNRSLIIQGNRSLIIQGPVDIVSSSIDDHRK